MYYTSTLPLGFFAATMRASMVKSNDSQKYAASGKQTAIEDNIQQIAEKLSGEGLGYIVQVLDWVLSK